MYLIFLVLLIVPVAWVLEPGPKMVETRVITFRDTVVLLGAAVTGLLWAVHLTPVIYGLLSGSPCLFHCPPLAALEPY